MKKHLVLFVIVALAAVQMCITNVFAGSGDSSAAKPAAGMNQAAPPSASQSQDQDVPISGKVIETMTSGGYTYALVESGGKKIWVAIPATKLTVGQEATFRPGADMGEFESKTLKRKFDEIIFSPGLVGQPFMAHGTEMSSSAEAVIKVEKAQGPNSYTIHELISNSAKLDKKPVVVRGKVVKVSEQIMGKNWVHIKDGSDNQKAKIVATSNDLPKVGDVVTVKGTLYKDKDFGSGYKYSVIIEDATIK
jgi:hypothetical protein